MYRKNVKDLSYISIILVHMKADTEETFKESETLK